MGNHLSRQRYSGVAHEAFLNAQHLQYQLGEPPCRGAILAYLDGRISARQMTRECTPLGLNEFRRLAFQAYVDWARANLDKFLCYPDPVRGRCQYPHELLHRRKCQYRVPLPEDIEFPPWWNTRWGLDNEFQGGYIHTYLDDVEPYDIGREGSSSSYGAARGRRGGADRGRHSRGAAPGGASTHGEGSRAGNFGGGVVCRGAGASGRVSRGGTFAAGRGGRGAGASRGGVSRGGLSGATGARGAGGTAPDRVSRVGVSNGGVAGSDGGVPADVPTGNGLSGPSAARAADGTWFSS